MPTTTTTLPAATCQPYTSDCAAVATPDTFTASGGAACENLGGKTFAYPNADTSDCNPLGAMVDTTSTPGAQDLSVGTFPTEAGFNSFNLDPSSTVVGGDGSITLNGNPELGFTGDSFCNGLTVIRVLDATAVITKVCGVGEPVLGHFEGHYQISDGSSCDSTGQFLMYRTQ